MGSRMGASNQHPLKRPSLTGTRLGRFLLGPQIGTGGAASVYLASLRGPHDFERVLAVKVVHEHLAESDAFVTLFLDEANLAARLVHPNIVHSYELGREGPHLFLAMEYLAGQPLSNVIARTREHGETLPPGLVAWIGARCAEALAYAHSLTDDAGHRLGLVHRDVSPQNVFLTYEGRVVLIDFGIARAGGPVTQTDLGRIKGKVKYMPVEQLLREQVDHRADVFSLGATLYEAAVGQGAFEAADEAESIANLLEDEVTAPEDARPGFPADLSRVLMRALRREPRDRYGDAFEMARALDSAASRCEEPSAALSELLKRLFATERAAQAQAVAALRSKRVSPIRQMPPEATTTANSMAATIHPVARQGRSWSLVAALSAGALASAIALKAVAPARESAPATSAASRVPEASQLEVQVDPAVSATITVDGRVEHGPRVRFVLETGAKPVTVEVVAPGFEPASVRAVPDRNQLVLVRLKELPKVAASPGPLRPLEPATPARTKRTSESDRGAIAHPASPLPAKTVSP